VIVTADHGENFGEAGFIGHGFSLNEALIHVPLVMAGPGTIEMPGAFSLAGLPRMLARAAEIEEHPWHDRELPGGVAIAQYDPIGPADHPRVRSFAERWDLDEDAVARLTASFTSVTDGRRKLVVRNDDRPLLYDLERDPGEREPVDPCRASGSFDDLSAALEHPSLAPTPTAAVGNGASEVSVQELEALERQMKLLGYL
jgi:arylsulfatase A-like enzyme